MGSHCNADDVAAVVTAKKEFLLITNVNATMKELKDRLESRGKDRGSSRNGKKISANLHFVVRRKKITPQDTLIFLEITLDRD